MTGDPPTPPAIADLTTRYALPDASSQALTVLVDRLAADPRAPISALDRERALDRHIADSLAALDLQPVRDARLVADLGSGAGLPALVLAAANPHAAVRAVESREGKCAWIAELALAAGLRNVEVVCHRAEEWPDGIGRHDLVTARALAAQPVVLEYAAPLLAPGGHLVEWRGRRDEDDEARGDAAAGELGLTREGVRRVTPFPGARARHLHVFRKTAATPPGFPRRAGVAAKRPLGSGAAVPGRR
jgi:16S rRNA (guanine527-N7)-methyltransferase